MRKNQSGFSIIEILIVVVILGLIGGAGWYAWHATNKSAHPVSSPKTNTSKGTNQTPPVSSPANTNQPVQTTYTPKPLVADFSISSWGVKFKVAQDLNKLTYEVTGSDTIGFAYSGWESLDPNCAASKGGAGFLRRYDERSLSSEDSESIKERADTKLGNYYYIYEAPQAPCSSNQHIMDEQTSTQFSINLRNSIKSSLTSL